jgi:hypothetical protein
MMSGVGCGNSDSLSGVRIMDGRLRGGWILTLTNVPVNIDEDRN